MPSQKRSIIVIAHDIRSTHNIGSLLRTADGLGVHRVCISGISPYPIAKNDTRLPHIAVKLHKQIQKTALGAESSMPWEYSVDVLRTISQLRDQGYVIAALEQNEHSIYLPSYNPPDKIALILGNEVTGVSSMLIKQTSVCLEIPMFGAKESFNVVQAAAIALYHLQLGPFST